MGRFFRACQGFESESEINDIFYSRYHGSDMILKMPFLQGFELFSFAKKEAKRKQAFQQWIQYLPFMSMKYLEYMPFEQFYERITGANIDLRTNADIIAEIEALHGIKIEVDNGNI